MCANVGTGRVNVSVAGLSPVGSEWVTTCKTKGCLSRLADGYALRTAHSYEVPEIVAAGVEAEYRDYLAWVATETGVDS